MSRFTENKSIVESMDEIIKELNKKADELSEDSIRNINLGAITVILADISKSLAVIADALDKEEE